MEGYTGERRSLRQKEREKLWARAWIVVSVEGDGKGRVNRLRTGWFE